MRLRGRILSSEKITGTEPGGLGHEAAAAAPETAPESLGVVQGHVRRERGVHVLGRSALPELETQREVRQAADGRGQLGLLR